MRTGAAISAIGHSGLVLWLMFGGLLVPRDPPVPDSVNVSLVSAAEFAALAARPLPEISQEVASPEPPQTDTAPELAARPEPVPDTPRPRPADTPAPPDQTPAALPQPTPEAEVTDIAPDTPPSPEPEAGAADALPDTDPAPRPVPRVAPVPAPAPPETAETAPDTAPAVAPAPTPEPVPEPAREAAPEEAAPEIVTEAETPSAGAPTTSMRPRARPPRPAATAAAEPAADPTPEPVPEADPLAAAIADAVADANAQPPPETVAPVASGPPLTRGERDALRVAVERCWNVGSLSSDALSTTVVVGVAMLPDGTPNIGSIRLISSEGGSQAAARQAFEAARRAIIRCGANGYDLPEAKYARWRDIEMTFNPESMRIR